MGIVIYKIWQNRKSAPEASECPADGQGRYKQNHALLAIMVSASFRLRFLGNNSNGVEDHNCHRTKDKKAAVAEVPGPLSYRHLLQQHCVHAEEQQAAQERTERLEGKS